MNAIEPVPAWRRHFDNLSPREKFDQAALFTLAVGMIVNQLNAQEQARQARCDEIAAQLLETIDL